jgi:hypothetical protein
VRTAFRNLVVRLAANSAFARLVVGNALNVVSFEPTPTAPPPPAPPPTLSSLLPTSGPTTGGTAVRLTGTNFVAGATAAFGGVAAVGCATSPPTTISCLTPAHDAGPVDVTVRNPDGQTSTLTAAFTYVSTAPTLASVNPASGPTAGGQPVTLIGSNLDPAITVAIGGIAVAVSPTPAPTSTSIAVRTPAHAAGVVDITVRNPDGQAFTLAGAYTYLAPAFPAPTISLVAPNIGTAAGGQSVIVVGTGFQTGAFVTFPPDTTSAPGAIASVTDTQVNYVTPAHASGLYDVTVTNPDGQSATCTNSSIFVAPNAVSFPTFTTVSPASGPVAGGQTISLVGTVFQAGAKVFFGPASSCPPSGLVLVSSDTAISVVTPPHDPGPVEITIVNPDGSFVTLSNSYTYF